MNRIPLTRPYFDNDELDEVKKVLDSGWVAQGPVVKRFEAAVAARLGVESAVAVTNCTAALHLALQSCGVTRGDEVLVGDYTFPATGHAVLYCGGRPVFVDVDPGTYNIDPRAIEEKITGRTRAIIPVHTFGQPADMDPIMKIADESDLFVIEDAACALGARYRGSCAGTIGDIGCFSFHARKGITTGEGGMVVTGDRDRGEAIRYLSVFGMSAAWEREKSEEFCIPQFCDLGYNYKMSDITAAVGVAQMKKLDRIIERKRELAAYWDGMLEDMNFIAPPIVNRGAGHVYQSYVALVDHGIDRNRLIVALAKQGIQTQIGTYASHIQPVYRSADACPCSLDVYNRAIALPLFYSLREEEIDIMSEILKQTLGALV